MKPKNDTELKEALKFMREHANLIIAAPEMLEALEHAVKWIGKYIADGGHNSHIAERQLIEMEKTIKKARGES